MEWHDYRTDKPTEEGEYFVQRDYTEFTGNVTRTFFFDAYTNGRFQSEPLKPCGWNHIVAWMRIEPFEKRPRLKRVEVSEVWRDRTGIQGGEG